MVTTAMAQKRENQEQSEDRTRSEQPRRETLNDSVKRVERDTGGRVLRAEPVRRDGKDVHRIKVMTDDGKVRVLREDSRRAPAPPPPAPSPPKKDE